MDPVLVSCRDCARTWHSRTMAEGLRTIGSCPRCRGELVWADSGSAAAGEATPAPEADVAPHLVLGLPRR